MFREHLELISEAVLEGSNRGIESFLETLNGDIQMDEIIEESGGVEQLMMQLFYENGSTITALEEESSTNNSDGGGNIEEKIDTILENLKKEGLVD